MIFGRKKKRYREKDLKRLHLSWLYFLNSGITIKTATALNKTNYIKKACIGLPERIFMGKFT